MRGHAVIAYTALAFVLLSAIALGANRPATWTMLSIGISALFFAITILNALWGSAPALRSAAIPGFLYLLVVTWSLFQILASPGVTHPVWDLVPEARPRLSADPATGMHVVIRLLCYGMAFWIAASVARAPVLARRLIMAIAWFSSALAIYGLYAYLIGDNPILGFQANNEVLTATFVNRNSYALFAVFGVLANLVLLQHHMKADREGGSLRDGLEAFFRIGWIYGFGIFLGLSAIALTQSRAGAVAMLVGLVAYFAGSRKRRSNRGTLYIALMLGLVLLVLLAAGSNLIDRLLTSPDEGGRFVVYPSIVAAILERPIWGHGLGAFHDMFAVYLKQEAAVAEWNLAHNSYLENAFEMGLPAAVLFYLALALIALRLFYGVLTRRRGRRFPVFALACLAAGAFHALFDFTLQMPATASLFAIILGIGYAQSFSSQKK